MSSRGKQYCYEVWEQHEHQPISEYEADGKTLRTCVSWPCRLCGAPCDPWSYASKILNVCKPKLDLSCPAWLIDV